MESFWLKFNERSGGCVEATDGDSAARIAKEITGFEPKSCERLPYPAEPRINMHHDEKYGVCPSFCHAPERCRGNTSCPQNYSCTE